MSDHQKLQEHKSDIRSTVWKELLKVAKPDSRFHFNFAEFIADFEGSSYATKQFLNHKSYKNSNLIFITPDNCLEELRYETLKLGKKILITTYSIKRGFWLLDPSNIPESHYLYASTLDGLEKMGKPISLTEIKSEKLKVDLMVTGTGAINDKGIRFGKGHGFFDSEWGMLYKIGSITTDTVTVAFVHDCQLLEGVELKPEEFDTVCDLIFTNTRTINVEDAHKPKCGIIWDILDKEMFETIPPLQELKRMEL